MIEHVFLDTAYAFALINQSDKWHLESVDWQQKIIEEGAFLLTTEYILCEIADGLASIKYRKKAIQLIRILEQSEIVKIIPASTELLHRGLSFFEKYSDKDFSLTDCISFTIMKEFRIRRALTSDHHFSQVGFIALLGNRK
jgi:hypothetical protein